MKVDTTVQTFYLALLYRPPTGNVKTFLNYATDEVIPFCLDMKLYFMGDFNIQMNKGIECRKAQMLNEFLIENDLVQHVDFPTHKQGNTLDLLITNSSISLIL